MKKFTILLFYYLTFLCIFVILQSCCTKNYKIIGNGACNILDEEYNSIDSDIVDTINFNFILSSWFESETSMLEIPQFINSAYAFSCDENFANQLDSTSIHISCNRDFVFDTETINAGNNFKKSIPHSYSLMYGVISFMFNDEFLSKANFQKGETTFSIKAETDDGLELENSITLNLDL